MIDPFSLVSSGLAFFVVAVTPGPANISNATIAMAHGRETSLVYSTGLSTGLVFWGLIAASGMGAVLQSSLYALVVLKVFGGMYLLWLAFQSGRAALNSGVENLVVASGQEWFLRGLLLNMSNPKSVMAWMAALSVGLDATSGVGAVIAATAVCICVGFANNAVYSILFSVDGMMRGYQRFQGWINGVAASLFAVAGFGLIRSAFASRE